LYDERDYEVKRGVEKKERCEPLAKNPHASGRNETWTKGTDTKLRPAIGGTGKGGRAGGRCWETRKKGIAHIKRPASGRGDAVPW